MILRENYFLLRHLPIEKEEFCHLAPVPPLPAPIPVIQIARLLAPNVTFKGFVVIVTLEDEAATAALRPVVINGLFMAHRHGAVGCLIGVFEKIVIA